MPRCAARPGQVLRGHQRPTDVAERLLAHAAMADGGAPEPGGREAHGPALASTGVAARSWQTLRRATVRRHALAAHGRVASLGLVHDGLPSARSRRLRLGRTDGPGHPPSAGAERVKARPRASPRLSGLASAAQSAGVDLHARHARGSSDVEAAFNVARSLGGERSPRLRWNDASGGIGLQATSCPRRRARHATSSRAVRRKCLTNADMPSGRACG